MKAEALADLMNQFECAQMVPTLEFITQETQLKYLKPEFHGKFSPHHRTAMAF